MTNWESHRRNAIDDAAWAGQFCNKRFFRKKILEPLVPSFDFPTGNGLFAQFNAVRMNRARVALQSLIASWPQELRNRYVADHLERYSELIDLEQEYAELHVEVLRREAQGTMLAVVVYNAAQAEALVWEMRQKVKMLDLWRDVEN